MREAGIPVDAMTIDCLRSNKRIIILLNDLEPEIMRYQFSFKDQDPNEHFETISTQEINATTLYKLIENYLTN